MGLTKWSLFFVKMPTPDSALSIAKVPLWCAFSLVFAGDCATALLPELVYRDNGAKDWHSHCRILSQLQVHCNLIDGHDMQ